jgi:hypothetical protein
MYNMGDQDDVHRPQALWAQSRQAGASERMDESGGAAKSEDAGGGWGPGWAGSESASNPGGGDCSGGRLGSVHKQRGAAGGPSPGGRASEGLKTIAGKVGSYMHGKPVRRIGAHPKKALPVRDGAWRVAVRTTSVTELRASSRLLFRALGGLLP